MKTITRDTIRADGLTVGQSLDNEAAFLRNLGFDAKDGVKPYGEKLEDFREQMRLAVLAAMDLVAASVREDGPKDADLPKLFPVIDNLAERIFNASKGL